MGVWIPPGCTELTRMPSGPRSMAAVFESPRRPHLLATYAPPDGSPTIPALEEMLMIDPPPARSIDGVTTFIPLSGPIRLMSSTWRTRATSARGIGVRTMIRALFTRQETAPERAARSATEPTHQLGRTP